MNNDTLNLITNKLNDGLSEITKLSYTNCKYPDPIIASNYAKINNTAFELKRLTVLLQKEINLLKQS